jgi:GH25 family lysozyme M1 (1,4-beta-N-acetylmuramidase)
MSIARPELFIALVAFTAVVFSAAPARAQGFINGVDVSHYQGTINWTNVFNSGTKFAFMKATQGYSYVDPTFSTNIRDATRAGVLVGPYHFTDFDLDPTNSQDPIKQANHFLAVIKPYYDAGLYLPPVADVEGFGNLSANGLLNRTFLSNWVQSFSNTIYNSLGVRPIIYTSQSPANNYYTSSVASQHDLWLASWKSSGTANPPTASDTPLWGPWEFWQWTDAGTVSGIGGAVDRDLYNGTLSTLQSLRIGKGATTGSHIVRISDFNEDEGYFGTVPTYSGTNRNISSVTADQVTTQAYEGAGSEKLSVNGSDWTLRFLSGIGNPPANPSTNLGLSATGNVGFWLKTSDAGVTAQIMIDDATDNSVIEPARSRTSSPTANGTCTSGPSRTLPSGTAFSKATARSASRRSPSTRSCSRARAIRPFISTWSPRIPTAAWRRRRATSTATMR